MAQESKMDPFAALGLDPSDVVETWLTQYGADAVTRGLSIERDVHASGSSGASRPGWEKVLLASALRPIDYPAAEAAGFDIAVTVTPGLGHYGVATIDGAPLGVAAVHPEAVLTPSGALVGVRFALPQAGAVVLCRPDGAALMVQDVSGRAAWHVMRNREPLFPDGATELAACLDGARDAWLVDQVRHAAPADRYARLALVGQFARLLEMPHTRDERASFVAGLLAGQPDARFAGPRRWAAAFAPTQRALVLARALAEAARVQTEIDAAIASPEQTPDLLQLLYARDDLEGVRLLLRQGGLIPSLDAALELLDLSGMRLGAEAFPDAVFDDERLRRVARIDADSWWSAFAV